MEIVRDGKVFPSTPCFFDDDLCLTLCDIMHDVSGDEFTVNVTSHLCSQTLWLISTTGEAELRVCLFNETLIVSRAHMGNTRRGGFTRIVASLLCKALSTPQFNMRKFCVESVCTEAMRDWCVKCGLESGWNGTVPDEDGLCANYGTCLPSGLLKQLTGAEMYVSR